MTPEDIGRVQLSFTQVLPVADQVAEAFYARLFEVDPDIKPLFTGDMHKQGAMLIQALTMTVNNLYNTGAIIDKVRAMGDRHAGYGVDAAHYPVVGDCLIWALQYNLGDDFTPEVKRAWERAYQMLAEEMILATRYPEPE